MARLEKAPRCFQYRKRKCFAFNNYKQAFISSTVSMKAFSFLMSFFQARSLAIKSI